MGTLCSHGAILITESRNARLNSDCEAVASGLSLNLNIFLRSGVQLVSLGIDRGYGARINWMKWMKVGYSRATLLGTK